MPEIPHADQRELFSQGLAQWTRAALWQRADGSPAPACWLL